MHKLVVCLLFCLALQADAQSTLDRITTGRIDTLYSTVLDEQRTVWVHVPDDLDSTKRYGVVYAFDGGGHFNALVSMTELLRSNQITPPLLVVGVIHTDRGRELTPTHVRNMAPYNASDTTFSKTSGGGEALTQYLETELIPYIESTYPASRERTLVGHSTGGLIVINTLLNHPQLFTNYLAIDPSMWWDSQRLLKQSKASLRANRYDGKALFVSLANTLPGSMSVTRAEKDTTVATLHFRSARQLVRFAEVNPKNGLRFNWKYYPQETHGSVSFLSEYDGLRHFFKSSKVSQVSKP